VEDPEYRRLADATETMIRFHRAVDEAALLRVWDNLTVREQRMVLRGLPAMVAHLRAERGDPPDAEYGPG
jgi:hypothetical protein